MHKQILITCEDVSSFAKHILVFELQFLFGNNLATQRHIEFIFPHAQCIKDKPLLKTQDHLFQFHRKLIDTIIRAVLQNFLQSLLVYLQ